MPARTAAPVYYVRPAVSFAAAQANLGPGRPKPSPFFSALNTKRFRLPLKLLPRMADSWLVRKSALAAVTLALCGMALPGFGWSGDHEASNPAASPVNYNYMMTSRRASPPWPGFTEYGLGTFPKFTFRHEVPEVRLQFTVADEQGRPVSSLSPKDIRVLEDQLPVPAFTDFGRGENLPLRLGIVLDTSDSVRRVLPDQKTAALTFVTRIMRPETDTAFIMGFGGDVQVWQLSTSVRQELVNAIGRLKQPGWGTRMFDALYSACADQLFSLDDPLARRALIVLSDGNDTESFHSLPDVIFIAERSEIQVYALALHVRRRAGRGDRVLQEIAEATGGRFYIAESSRQLDGAFAQIVQDLRSQYYVSFTPRQTKPGFHSLRVELKAGPKVEVHARQGYYARAH